MLNQTITLADGRRLGYAFYGPQNGQPVLYFHGTPSSRLELQLHQSYTISLEAILQEAGIRLIAVDRPGMGLSWFNPKGTFISFADDAYALLYHLGIKQCSLLCWSGGGPYGLAMAHQYPSVITSLTIICGFSRRFDAEVLRQSGPNKWYFLSARYIPWITTPVMNLLAKKETNRTLPQLITGLPYADYKLMEDLPHFRTLARLTMKEACLHNAKGAVHEAKLYFKDFGFRIEEIHQPVHYWWGTSDKTVIRLHAEAVEQKIPGSKLHYVEGEGHFSIYIWRMKEIIQNISHLMTLQ